MRCDEPVGIDADAQDRAALVFFAQRMEELTSPRTLDSYKAYAVNIPTLLEEAIEQIEAIRDAGPGISPTSANCIIDELAARAKSNLICSSMIRPERELVATIKSGEAYLSKFKQLSQELAGWAYATQAMAMLTDQIDAKQKRKMEFLAGELVTTLVNLGMSRRHIHESTLKFFWESRSNLRSLEDLKEFFKIIFPHYHEFSIFFTVEKPISTIMKEEFSSLNVKFIKEIPENLKSFADDNGFICKYGCFLAVADKIRAFDCHSAIDAALKKITLIQNLFRMYNHESGFSLGGAVLSEQCCSSTPRVVEPEAYTRRPVSDASKPIATKKLKNLISDSRFLRGRAYDKFLSVSEFHGHSLESASLENKLLNLWISLETMCPSKKGLSKIDNVVTGAIPVLGLNYINRIISALSHDLFIWDRAVIKEYLNRIDGDYFPQVKLLLLCAQSSNETTLVELLKKMDGQELLRYRIHRINQAFSGKDSTKKALESHLERASWQLRRIYRARNSIVHLGRVPEFISALVDSAHDYFDQLLTTAADISIGPNGFSDFDAGFEFMAWEYGAYFSGIDAIDFDDPESMRKLLWQRTKAVSRYDVLKVPGY